MQATLTILGSGSSAGTPVVGCKCETCLSINPRNTRTRCSSLITLKNGKNILIDTSPDLREQSLRESITKVDAVLFTHAHADHCHGIDDLRAFCQINKIQIPLYGNQDVMNQLSSKFKYAMIEPKNFWELPVLKPNVVDAPFKVFDEIVTPIPIMHGNSNINGYRVGNLGYITDASEISDNSMKLLEGVDVLLLDCLRMEPHFTHLSFSESVEIAKKINAKKTYLIHMMHTLEYESLKKMLPEGVYVGYDGLKLQIN
jgi:phosphoribosyl 1,2-cyclic phosphate phosphodiesterase